MQHLFHEKLEVNKTSAIEISFYKLGFQSI